jgi:SAM-dependent methyltransferase
MPRQFVSILKREIWDLEPGEIFELGCGSSQVLTKSAFLGWRVSGIDFHKESKELMEFFFTEKNLKIGELICGDIFDYDCTLLANKYDILFSSGFLEHFNSPEYILQKWSIILKSKGKVISIVPNLNSLNGKFMKKLAYEWWGQHIVFTPYQLDKVHLNSGLKIIKPAIYAGGFDLNSHIPWGGIKPMIPLIIFKFIRYFVSFVISPFLNVFFRTDHKLINPIIIGIYEKP